MLIGVNNGALKLVMNCLERDAEQRPVRAEILDDLRKSCKDVVQDTELTKWMKIVHDPALDLGNRLQALSIELGKYVEQPTFEADEKMQPQEKPRQEIQVFFVDNQVPSHEAYYENLDEAIEAAVRTNSNIIPLTRLGAVHEGLKLSIDDVTLHGFDVVITNTLSGAKTVLCPCISRTTAVVVAKQWAAFFGIEFKDSK